MDLQFVAESSLAIAQYVTGYVTKAEKSNMQDIWHEVSSHKSVYSKLWSFGVSSLRFRVWAVRSQRSPFGGLSVR